MQDSGLLDALLPAFERRTGIQVRVTAVGSGKALELGRLGEADAVLCHAPALEEAFVRDGFSQDRRRVASNDFVIAGPANDSAGVLFSYRYFFTNHQGVELNYGFSRFNQQYSSLNAAAPFSLSVPANTNEATASYVYRRGVGHR